MIITTFDICIFGGKLHDRKIITDLVHNLTESVRANVTYM